MNDITIVPISNLPAAGPVSNNDLVILGQGGLAKQAPLGAVLAGNVPNPLPPVDGSAVLVTADGSTTQLDLGARFAEVINIRDKGAKGDLLFATGTLSWNGNTVTISGGTFSAADIGKSIILPAGADNTGVSVPVITTITDVPSIHVLTVAATATHAISGASAQLNVLSAPDSIVVNAAGTGYRVDDVLSLVGGTYDRPGSVRVMLTKVLSATVVNAGNMGPPGPITLTGTTGQGKRFQATGTVSAGGSIAGALTIAVQGGYWFDMTAPAMEPVSAFPLAHSVLGTFTSGSTSVTVDSATGLVIGNPIVGTGIPNGTTITNIVGAVLTISQSTTAPGTNAACTVTNNSQPVYTTATFTSGATSVTVASATGLSIGMAVAGPAIPGGGDPTQSSSTRITGISGTTITLSAATTAASPTPVSFTAFPMLTGAILSVTTAVHTVALRDVGLYSVLPTFPAAVTGGSGTGATLTPRTSSLLVPYGTDDTAAINAAYAAARAIAAAAAPLDEYDGSFTVVWPAGNYLCLSPVITASIKSGGYKVISDGAVLYSAAVGGIAYDAFNSRWTLFEGPMLIYGDQSFPPRIGFAAGTTGNGGADSLNYNGLDTVGRFSLCGAYLIGTETSTFKDCRFWNHADAAATYGLILDGSHHWDVSSTFQPQTLPFNSIVQPFGGLLTPNIDIRVFGGSPIWMASMTEARLQGYCAGYGPPGIMLKGSLSGGGGINTRPEFQMHFETTRMQDVFFIFGDNSNAPFPNGLTYVDGGSQAANSLFALDTAGNFGVPIVVLLLTGSQINVGFMEPGARVFDNPNIVTYIGGATFGEAVPQIAWNVPSFFNGTLVLKRKLTVSFGGANVGSDGLGVGGNISANGSVSANGGFTGGSISLGPAGTAPVVTAGTDPNGNLSLGHRGTNAFPSSSTPYIDFFGPGNVGATQDARLIVGSAGTLSVVGPSPGQAALAALGLLSSYGQLTPWANVGTLANGGTLALPASNAAASRRGMIVVSGSIATGTIILPSSAPNGFNSQFATTGTIGALTVVAADSAVIVGAPTTLNPSAAGRLVFHTEVSPNAWYSA